MIPVTAQFLWIKDGEICPFRIFIDQDKAIKYWRKHGGDLYIRVLKGKDDE